MIKKALIIIWNEIWLFVFKSPVYHPRFWEDERMNREFTKNIGIVQRYATLLSGFNSDKYLLYDFSRNDKKQYLNDIRRRILSERISKRHYYLVHNKIVFNKYFEGKCNLIPKLAMIRKGRVQPLQSVSLNSASSLIEMLDKKETLFLKPFDGGSGRGIYMVEGSDDKGGYLINKEKADLNEVEKLIASLNGYVVEKKFDQIGFSHKFYPTTLNTLRIYTMIDTETDEAFVAVALHRIGTNRSKTVDNWSKGGLSVWINPESGLMSKGIQYPFDGEVIKHSSHPDTNVQLEGEVVPGWDLVRETILGCANYVYFLPLLGWDVVLSDGKVYILEANYNPDVNLIQVHKPLLADERIARFYKHHKVIR